MTIKITCPHCTEEFSLREARTDQQWRELITLLAKLPRDVHQAFLQYAELFKPAKQKTVRSGTLLKLMKELLPLIEAQQIERHRTHYTVDYATWARAMQYLFDRKDTMQLPLKGNGYLLEMLANNAEKREAQAERQQMQKQQYAHNRPSTGGFQDSKTLAKQAAQKAADQEEEETPNLSPEQRKANLKKLGGMLQEVLSQDQDELNESPNTTGQ